MALKSQQYVTENVRSVIEATESWPHSAREDVTKPSIMAWQVMKSPMAQTGPGRMVMLSEQVRFWRPSFAVRGTSGWMAFPAD
jgi:hypothetical protein